MEAQIESAATGGTGFDVPEQGLHLRVAGMDAGGRTVRRGALDTSLGPISIETLDDGTVTTGRGWHGPDDHTDIVAEATGEETVVAVEEQFVSLERDGDAWTGTLATAIGTFAVRDEDGRISLRMG